MNVSGETLKSRELVPTRIRMVVTVKREACEGDNFENKIVISPAK